MCTRVSFQYRSTRVTVEWGVAGESDVEALRAFFFRFMTVFPIFCLQAGKVYSIYFVSVLL